MPKNIREQLKKEILSTLNTKTSSRVGSELKLKTISDFTVKNYRAQKSFGLARVRSGDLFEFDSKGLLVMKDQVTSIL